MKFTGQLSDVSIDYKTNKPKITFLMNEKSALENLDEIKDLDKLSVEASKYREKRSLDANAYFHVLVNKLARHYNMSDTDMKIKMNLDYGTVALNLDGTKVAIKVPKGTNIQQFYPYCKWFGECEEGELCFDKFLMYKQTHTLNTKEMAKLIDGVVQECKDVGIEVATPAELESMKRSWGT